MALKKNGGKKVSNPYKTIMHSDNHKAATARSSASHTSDTSGANGASGASGADGAGVTSKMSQRSHFIVCRLTAGNESSSSQFAGALKLSHLGSGQLPRFHWST